MRALALSLLTLTAFAQSSPRTFKAAEIRIKASEGTDSRGDIQNRRLYIRNLPLRFLIAEAWRITREEVIGPSWLDDIRVDVVAQAESPTTSDSDVHEMLRSLLKERMRLVAHQEQQERPAWALTVWRGQNKMKSSSMPVKPEDASCTLSHDDTGAHFACGHLTMGLLALKLPHVAASDLDIRVVDMTGLEGAWDLALDWMPQPRADTEGGLTLFAALQAQAGLQLSSRKLPSSVLVVDSMEKTPESQ